MARYLIINTGGTIGMTPGPRGLEPNPDALSRAFAEHPSLQPWDGHELIWEHWSPLLDSSDLQPRHWYQLKEQILRHPDVDGTLVIHGTDTLAYSAAALSFLLNDQQTAVVITGAMHPIAETGSDAINNLLRSLQALQDGRPEVVVAIGSELLPGSRITKASTLTTDSFQAPGWPLDNWQTDLTTTPLNFTRPWQEPVIDVLTLYPGCRMPDADSVQTKPPQAVLINAYGNGNAADTPATRSYLAALQAADIPVFVRSQCFEGQVSFGQYAASAVFADHEAVSCGTMSFEAAITKLQLLCSESDDARWIRRHFATALAREWQ